MLRIKIPCKRATSCNSSGRLKPPSSQCLRLACPRTDTRSRRRHSSNKFDSALATLRNCDFLMFLSFHLSSFNFHLSTFIFQLSTYPITQKSVAKWRFAQVGMLRADLHDSYMCNFCVNFCVNVAQL